MQLTEQTSRGVAVLILLVGLAYLPVFDAGYTWDDDDYVTDNPSLTEPGGLGRIWTERGATPQYYPLVFTSFWIERGLFGESALAHHVTNVLLHLASACLLWVLLARLRIRGAFFAAALFAVHPIQVESVAWITERKNVLSMLLYLAAALAWLRFDEQRRAVDYASLLVLFAGALLSKSVTASLPAAIVVVALYRDGRAGLRVIPWLLPLFAMGLAAATHTARFERDFVFDQVFDLGLTTPDRVVIAGRAIWFYLGQLALPLEQCFIYPRFDIDPGGLTAWVAPAAVVATTLALFVVRRRIGSGLLTAWILFIGALVPALGFVDVYPMIYSYVADHFAYHATPAFMAVAGAGLARLPSRAAVVAAAVIAACALLSNSHAASFHDADTLWRATLRCNPAATIAHNNLAASAARRGDEREELRWLELAVEVDPRRQHPWVVAIQRHSLALKRLRTGRVEEACDWFEATIEAHPRYFDAYVHLAQIREHAGDRAAAVALYRRLLDVEPRHIHARRELERLQGG